MATNAELEQRTKNLEKSIDDLQSAVRRLSQEHNDALTGLNKLADTLNTVRTEVARLKLTVSKLEESSRSVVKQYE